MPVHIVYHPGTLSLVPNALSGMSVDSRCMEGCKRINQAGQYGLCIVFNNY